MSRPQIVFSLQADRDLDALFDWIARDSGAGQAEAILCRIGETLDLIAEAPAMGRVRKDLDGEPRVFAVRPWLIVYDLLPTGRGIAVWRVIDGRRDLPRHIAP